jgi:hypothetical protein
MALPTRDERPRVQTRSSHFPTFSTLYPLHDTDQLRTKCTCVAAMHTVN